VASTAVGAVAGGLVRDCETGLVVAPGDPEGLAGAITRLLEDELLRRRLGAAARTAVASYTYDAMLDAFSRALAVAISPSPTGP
jgi:glycosyltransferase involved in cell wall biosynthesis